MREISIEVYPFEMVSILEYKGLQTINEHGYVKMTGLIRSDRKDFYEKTAETCTWVKITGFDERGTGTVLFYGILTDFSLRMEGDSCIMELSVFSGSRLMDYREHTRSFQRSGYTFKEIAECCNAEYEQVGMIMTEGREMSVPGFLMQYKETDWAFLRRLASIAHTVLVPSCNHQGVKYFFGIPRKQAECGLESDTYTVCRKQDGSGKRGEILYRVESRDWHALGDWISFQGELFFISRIETIYRGNELLHTYTLKPKQGLVVSRIYLQGLTGISLMGKVTGVADERVQIRLDIDENGQSGSRWFPFASIYSSADGTGWYCMPEEGDHIRLNFPTDDEADAYGVNACQENQGNGYRTNPDHKIWRNKEGKEIRLTPNRVLLTNNKGMSVELDDGSGIRIKSNGFVMIDAAKTISIHSAEAGLELAASSKITLEQGETKMEMSDGISLSGAEVKMQ